MDSEHAKTFDPSKIVRSSSSTSLLGDDVDGAFFVLPSELPSASLRQQKEVGVELDGRIPISHCWDHSEPQILAVEWSGAFTQSVSGARLNLERRGKKRADNIKFGKVRGREGWVGKVG